MDLCKRVYQIIDDLSAMMGQKLEPIKRTVSRCWAQFWKLHRVQSKPRRDIGRQHARSKRKESYRNDTHVSVMNGLDGDVSGT